MLAAPRSILGGVRPLLITTEPAGVRRGSGTAVAVDGLAEALALHGIHLSIARSPMNRLGHTVTRWRDRRPAPLAEHAYDVVLGLNGDGRTTAAAAGLPFVALPKALYAAVAAHEVGVTRALMHRHAAWEAAACRSARLVVVPSAAAAAQVARRYGVPGSRLEVIGEPFAAQRWGEALPPVEREGRRVLVVAHLYPRKRVAAVLAAWPAVLQGRPDALLEIVGDGPCLAAVRRLAAGLPGVSVHGHLAGAALRHAYATADVAVSVSAHETFGYSVVEALASGLPVVVGGAPAVLELTATATGRQVTTGDPRVLAEAIVDSLSPAVAAAAAVTNPPIAARFEPAVVGAAYAAVLERVAR